MIQSYFYSKEKININFFCISLTFSYLCKMKQTIK